MSMTSVDGEDDDVYVKPPIINTVLGLLMCGVNAGTVVKIATQFFSLPGLTEAADV